MAYNLFVNDNNRKRKGDINSIDKEACSCLDLLLKAQMFVSNVCTCSTQINQLYFRIVFS